VNHAGGADVVTVNQEVGGGNWQLLGTYSFNAGATTVSLSDDADGYVIADAVMLAPPGAAPNTATWSATIPSSGSYEVFARWTQHPNRASNAKYTVNHAGGSTQVIVNQMAGGGSWSSLGTFSFDAGAASVSLTDQADGYVIADAVMFLPPGSSPNSATWTPNVAQAGQYEVYALWTQHANRATDATYWHRPGFPDTTSSSLKLVRTHPDSPSRALNACAEDCRTVRCSRTRLPEPGPWWRIADGTRARA
jgi:hypothetical protein